MVNKKNNQQGLTPIETEGGRRTTGVSVGEGGKKGPEVIARITRRRLTNSYKLKVLNRVDGLRHGGGIKKLFYLL